MSAVAAKDACKCAGCVSKTVAATQKLKQKSKFTFWFEFICTVENQFTCTLDRNILFVVAWVVFLYASYNVSKSYTAETLYDPFETLGLPTVSMALYCTEYSFMISTIDHSTTTTHTHHQSATTTEIKKKYRELSLKYHPDRNAGNPDAAETFMIIAKAYETYVYTHDHVAWV